MTQLALVIDLNVCVGCHACVTSCKEWNTSGSAGPLSDFNPYDKDPTGAFFNRVQSFEVGEFPNTQTVHFPKSCLHCEDPPCVPVCPTGASYKRAEDGIVLVDYDKCIGCKYCAWACPYGVRELDEERQVMTKCTLCVDRITDEALPESGAQARVRARLPDQRAPVRRHPRSRFGRVDRDPRERRLCADAGMGHAPRQPLPAAAQDRAAHPRRRAPARRQSAQGRRPAAEAAEVRPRARRRDVLVMMARHVSRASSLPPEGAVHGAASSGRARTPMNPRISVILLTTLIGAGQGLFIALFVVEVGVLFELVAPPIRPWFYFYGALLAFVVHRRGTRRVVLPPRPTRARVALGGAVAHVVAVARSDRAAGVHGRRRCSSAAHFLGWNGTYGSASGGLTDPTIVIGFAGTVLALALYVCTGMIYACLPFLREWATPLTGDQLHAAGPRVGLRAGRGGHAGRAAARAVLRGVRAGLHAARIRESRSPRSRATRACAPSRRCRPPSASSIRASSRRRRASWAARSTRASSFTAGARRSCARSGGSFCSAHSWCPRCCSRRRGRARRRSSSSLRFMRAVPGIARRALVLLRAGEPSAESLLPGDRVAFASAPRALKPRGGR